jgi:hypothetical protein
MATALLGVRNTSSTSATFSMSGYGVSWYTLTGNPNAGQASVPAGQTWVITTEQGQNVMQTSAGSFNIWDNGNYQIMYQSTAPGSQPQLLANVPNETLVIAVAKNGSISGSDPNPC